MTSDYGSLTFEQQMDVIRAEVNFRKPQIQAAQAMWQDSKRQLDMQTAKFNDKLPVVASAWGPKDPNSTSFDNLLLDDMKVMTSWTDSIQNNQVGNQLATLSESIDFTMSTMATMATKHEVGAKTAQQSGKPFDDHDYRQFGAYLLNQLGTEYKKVAAGLDRVQGSEWTGRRVATSDSTGPGNTNNPDGTAGSNTSSGPGTDTPGATDTPGEQQTPDNKTPAEQQNPLGDTANAMDAASQAAQSLGGLLDGSGASDAASSIGDYNPSDLASMTPEDYAKYLDQLGSTSAGGPTLAGLDTSGVGGLGGGGVGSLG
ncbi:hypothetical protein FPZ12_014255, partial [Amycolatopsis acidicola]